MFCYSLQDWLNVLLQSMGLAKCFVTVHGISCLLQSTVLVDHFFTTNVIIRHFYNLLFCLQV